MKKLILCLAVLFGGIGTAMGQTANPGSWKAYDKINKANALVNKHTSEDFEQAQILYKEAEQIINNDIEEAKAKGKTAIWHSFTLRMPNCKLNCLTPNGKKPQVAFLLTR